MRTLLKRLRGAWQVLTGDRHAVPRMGTDVTAVWVVREITDHRSGLIPELEDEDVDNDRFHEMVELTRNVMQALLTL